MTEQEENSSRFDRAAGKWDANPGRVALAKGIVEAIHATVEMRPDMSAMDFGAGTGLVTLGLLPYVGRLTAMDASREMLRMLEAKLAETGIATVRTCPCDIARDPLPAAEFDLIVSSMVLHHIADVPRALKRLRPSLRPGGWIALADLDPEDGSFHADSTGVFHKGLDRSEVCRWLQEAGFAEPAAREAYRIVRPSPDGTPRVYPVFLVSARAG